MERVVSGYRPGWLPGPGLRSTKQAAVMTSSRISFMPNADQLQISPFWAPQRMDAEIPDAAQNGGYLNPICQKLGGRVGSASSTCS
jgi:hypothetical protein